MDINKLHADEIESILLEVDPKELGNVCRSSKIFNRSCRKREFREMYIDRWYLNVRRFYIEDVYKPNNGLGYAITLPYNKERSSTIDFFLDYSIPEINKNRHSFLSAIKKTIKRGDLSTVIRLLNLCIQPSNFDDMNILVFNAGKVNSLEAFKIINTFYLNAINNLVIEGEENKKIIPTLEDFIPSDEVDHYLWVSYLKGLALGAHFNSFRDEIHRAQTNPYPCTPLQLEYNQENTPNTLDEDEWNDILCNIINSFDQDRPRDSIDLFLFIKEDPFLEEIRHGGWDLSSINRSLWVEAFNSGRVEAIEFLINQGIPYPPFTKGDLNRTIKIIPLNSDIGVVNFLIDKGASSVDHIIGRLTKGDPTSLALYINILHNKEEEPYRESSEGSSSNRAFEYILTIFRGLFKKDKLDLAIDLLNHLTSNDLLRILITHINPGENKPLFIEIGKVSISHYQLTFLTSLINKLYQEGIFLIPILPQETRRRIQDYSSVEHLFWISINEKIQSFSRSHSPQYTYRVILLLGGHPLSNKGIVPSSIISINNNINNNPVFYPPEFLTGIVKYILVSNYDTTFDDTMLFNLINLIPLPPGNNPGMILEEIKPLFASAIDKNRFNIVRVLTDRFLPPFP